MVFNTGPYTVLPENSILITANMQLETGFPSSHQLKSYVASKFRLKLAVRAVLSADAGLLVFATKPLKWTQRAEILICCSLENSFSTRYSMISSCVTTKLFLIITLSVHFLF